MQQLLEKLDTTYRKSVKSRKREAEKRKIDVEPEFKVRIVPQFPFPIMSFHPDMTRTQTLNLLQPNDEIVIQSNFHTDKLVLVHVSKPAFNPHIFQLQIGVNCVNAIKIKSDYPENRLFYADISAIRSEDADQENHENRDNQENTKNSSRSRPISAVITRPYEKNAVPLEVLSTDRNEYDVRLRKDEFGVLSNPGTKIFISGTFLKNKTKPTSNFEETRARYAITKCNELVRDAARIIKKVENLSNTYIIALERLNKALEYVPNESNALTVRGALFIHRKKYGLAISDLEKVENENADAKQYLITAFVEQYKAEGEPTELLSKIRKYDPDNQIVVKFDYEVEKKRKLEVELKRKRKLAESIVVKREVGSDGVKKQRKWLDTTKHDMSREEKRKTKWKDRQMSEQLDKTVNKRSLDDILSAIEHFNK